jgi:hypothetical protein
MDILVFKTNIESPAGIQRAGNHLNSIGGIIKWNFDLDDSDNILRVESENLSPRAVESALKHAGCYCEELPD